MVRQRSSHNLEGKGDSKDVETQASGTTTRMNGRLSVGQDCKLDRSLYSVHLEVLS